MSNTAATVDFDVLVNGQEIADGDVMGFVVDHDLNMPRMCVITLRNQNHSYNDRYKPGQSVEIKVGGDSRSSADGTGGGTKPSIFKGLLVGIEPSYKQGGESKLALRAYDKLHKLTRGRASKTYQDQSDQDIASAIASEHGLSATCGSSPKITHKHVYRHNQSALEFLRTRAARLGFAIWCEDDKLYFDAPKLDQDSGLEFKLDKNAGQKLKTFHGRLSNAQVVKKVTVRGWDPEKKKEIVGEASAASSPLGSRNGAASLSDFGEVLTFTVDHPIASKAEADAIAKSRLGELAMSYLTAEAEAMGNNKVKAGIVVKIVVNQDVATDRFNGKYLVQGCTHRYAEKKGEDGGYTTLMRLVRDAEKGS